jgi:4-hydroxybenzoate polyprenyltransferase
MSSLARYARFVKVEHTFFSLPLLFAGAALAAHGFPSFRNVFLIIMAGFGARIVALALNRIFDARIDRLNPRTAQRELASGVMRFWEAWLLVCFGGAVYVFAAWRLNDLCFRLAWVPILAFAAYPLMKRLTRWSHVFLGAVWSLTPLGGFLAVRAGFRGSEPAWILAAFSLFWLAGFDIIYALQDEEFDRAHGLHSLPAQWGADRALVVSALFHALAFLCLVLLYVFYLTGPLTVLLLASCGALLYFEHRLAHNVDLAFFKINIATGFAVLGLVAFGL